MPTASPSPPADPHVPVERLEPDLGTAAAEARVHLALDAEAELVAVAVDLGRVRHHLELEVAQDLALHRGDLEVGAKGFGERHVDVAVEGDERHGLAGGGLAEGDLD